MALVMKTKDVDSFLETKLAVTDGVKSSFAIDGVTHAEVMVYPAQGEFTESNTLGMLQKPFIDFAITCGGAGVMTAEMITAKYPGFPADLAAAIAADFAKAYGNYVIIPSGMTLMITTPVSSVFELMIPENEEETEEETNV